MLEEVDSLRHRVRRDRRRYSTWAALTGMVALVGAASFLLSDQLVAPVSWSCDRTGDAGGCSTVHSPFNGAWAWHLAAVAAVAWVFWRRYREGSWRPSTAQSVALVLAVFFIGPTLLAGTVAPAVLYPAAAGLVLAVIAVVRGRGPAIPLSVIVAGGVVVVHWQMHERWMADALWYFERNVGLAVLSAVVALTAFAAAAAWSAKDRP